MIKVEFRAMGTKMAAFMDNEGPEAARMLQEVPVWFEEWEQVLSRFRPASDLNRLNASAGLPVRVNPVLWEVVNRALDLADWTGGLAVPTVLRSLERAGYDRSFDLLAVDGSRHPSTLQTDPAERWEAEGSGWQTIRMDALEQSITLPAGVKLDLGGIGKGWAAQKAMQRLKGYGPVLVDASGDIAVSGVRWDGSPWLVDIADPLHVQERLDMLALDGCGVATSGTDTHRWRQDGAWKHHIIDPRTGEPAGTDLVSVTVIAPDTARAEAAAKAVLILGSQAGMDWLNQKPELSGLLALQDGRLLYSQGIQSYLWE